MKFKFKLTHHIAILAALLCFSYSRPETKAEFSAEFSLPKNNFVGNGPGITVCVIPTVTTQSYQVPVVTFTPSVFSALNKQQIKFYSSLTTTQWDNRFTKAAGGLSVHLWHPADRAVIFGQFRYYQIPSFRSYIAGLEGYHEAMVYYNHMITQDPQFAHRLSHIPTNRKENAKDFIIGEAQKSAPIVAKKHEAFVRAQQAAIAKHQQQIAQLRAEKAATIKSQQEHFEAVVERAKHIEQPQSEQDTRLLRYAHAIKQTIKDNFATSSERYTILPSARALLDMVPHTNGDRAVFAECHGTTVQKFIHEELISNLNRIVCVLDKHKDNISLQRVAQSVAEFTHIGISYNNAGYTKQAAAISDLTAALADYGWAIAQGMKDGVTNIAHAALHPIDTATNIARSAAFVGYHLGKVLYEVCDITGTYMVDPVAGTEKFAQYTQNITALYREIHEKYDKLSGPEIVRAATTIATEAWLTGKCLGAAKTFYGHAQAKAVELATKVEQGFATAPELLASAEGLEVLVANEAAETTMLFSVKEGLNEACRTKMLKAAEDMTHYAEEFKKLGLNPISKKHLKHIFKNHVSGGQFATMGNRSIFYDSVNILDLAIEAWAKGTEIIPGEKIFDAGKIIGFAQNGSLTSKVQVCLNGTKDSIRTIYPL